MMKSVKPLVYERMADDDLMATANDEGEVEDCSWKVFFGANGSGFTCDNSTVIAKGLLELPTIRQIWMNHT